MTLRILTTVFLIGMPIFLYVLPVDYLDDSFIPCPFSFFLGVKCPGCGMTRAFMRILHGDFASSIKYNAYSIIFFALFALIYLAIILRNIKIISIRFKSRSL